MSAPIRYELTVPQMQIYKARSTKRFRLLNAGRRFGKTHLAAIELFENGVNLPRSINWYVAPTYRQAEQIAWEKFKELIPKQYILRKDEGDLSILLRNGSLIALRGSDNPDSLRGPGLDALVMDEAAFQRHEVWTKVLRAALSDKLGWALFISTPCGYNWFYDQFMLATTLPNWQAFQFTTLQGGNVLPSEIEDARNDLDEKSFRQEYEASFEALSGRVYYAFDRLVNISNEVDDGISPLLIGMDFNVDPMSAVVGIRKAGQLHLIDEIIIRDGNTELMAQELRKRFGNRVIYVYPDPTGNARKTSAPVGQTDFTILRSFGFGVNAPSMPYPVADKINTVNAAMKTASGISKVFVSKKCKTLIKAFDGLTYKEGTNLIDKASGLDHITDAAAYLILWELPIKPRGGRIIVQGV